MDSLPPCPPLLDILVDRINIGIFGVNRNMEITLWNRFMESHSGKSAAEVMGKKLFECFDALPHSILQNMMREAMSALAEASHRDGLTGIHNRRYIEEAVAKEFGRVQRYGGTLSIILFDLDNFKTIYDTLGHLTGDEVLRSAAKSIGTGVRTTDTFGRYGGEEFMALLPATNIDGAMILAERLRNHLASLPVIHGGLTVSVTVSAGVAEWQPNMQRYENLIKAADQALYRAKEQGRNCVRSADSEVI